MAACAAVVGLAAHGCSLEAVDGRSDGNDGGAADASPRAPLNPTFADARVDEDVTHSLPPTPLDMSGFTPTWVAPTALGQQRCSAEQVDAIMHCQLEPDANVVACQAITADKPNKDCATCLFSESTAARFGPVISGNGVLSLNLAGCIALLEPNVTNTGCGAKRQALDECTERACPYPIESDDAVAAGTTCFETARKTVCSTFAAGVACVDDLTAPGARAEVCALPGATPFVEHAIRYGNLFCGSPPPTDGGTDAPSGG